MTFKLSFRRASVVAAIATAAMLITMTPAAWADGSGQTTNGASNIDEAGNPTAPLCLPFTKTLEIDLWNEGSFNDLPGPYDTLATFTSDQDFWFNPAGTFNNSACLGAPTAVDGSLTVSDDVTCNLVGATYKRTTSDYEIKTNQPATCTITGTTNSHSDNLEFTGVQQACGGLGADPCDPTGTPTDSDNVEFVGVYEQGP